MVWLRVIVCLITVYLYYATYHNLRHVWTSAQLFEMTALYVVTILLQLFFIWGEWRKARRPK